jgi:hypothetical protein
VVDRLRLLLNRPLRDGARPRLFVVAVAVILIAAAALAALDNPGPPRRPARTTAAPPPAAASPPPVPAVASPAPTVPSEEGPAPAASLASRDEMRQAKRGARRFLAGYLRYSYGRGTARAIARAGARLRGRLSRERPRVPPAERRRRPRVLLVQSDGASPDAARLVALVADGRRRYTVALGLERTAAGWRVTSVGD